MRNLRMWLSILLLSVLSILVLNLSKVIIPGTALDSTGSYILLGLFAFGLLRWLRRSSEQYLSKPVLGWKFVIALALTINLIIVHLRGEDFSSLTASQWARGALFLFAVSFAEEIFSRGLIFGLLRRQGLLIATLGSSLLFGLMHINRYITDFDPWQAYWHIASAFAFGVFACALMVLTRSIWSPIVLHFFTNGGLLGKSTPTQDELVFRVSTPFLEGLVYPLPILATFLIPALFLFWLAADMPMHPRLRYWAIKWKLYEVDTTK